MLRLLAAPASAPETGPAVTARSAKMGSMVSHVKVWCHVVQVATAVELASARPTENAAAPGVSQAPTVNVSPSVLTTATTTVFVDM